MQYAKESTWIGVNEVIDPESLAEGYLSSGQNLRIEDGKIKNRGGHQKLVITNAISDGYAPVALGTIYGGVDYIGPTGVRSSITFGANNAFICTFGTHKQTLSYPAGVTISAPLQAFQADDQVRVMRGQGLQPMVLINGSSAFTLADSSTPPTSYVRMAPGQFGLYHLNRVWVLDGDVVKPSLVGNFDVYDPLFEYEIDTGTNDQGVGMYVYDQSTIVVGKKASAYVLTNITADLSLVNVERIEDSTGVEAPLGPVAVDGKLVLPTTNGIFPINQVFDTRLQGTAISLSDPIRHTFDGIDFSRFSEAVGVVHRGYYYLAVPMQLSTGNGRVLVYNLRTKAWMGYDEHAAAFDVRCWSKLTLAGEQVLVAFSKTGVAYLYGGGDDLADGLTDNSDNAVPAIAITRGFGGQPIGGARHVGVELKLRTQNPKYSVGYQLDGINETGDIDADITRSASLYSVIGKTPFDGTNVNGDLFNPRRQDYSLYADTTGFVIENSVNNLDYILLDMLQDSSHRLRISKVGRYFQVILTIKRGLIEMVGLAVVSGSNGESFTKGKTN